MNTEIDYSRGDAGELMSYMERDDHSLHNHVGDEMSQSEKKELIEKSDENDHTRQIILAPERDDLDRDQLHRATRSTMREFAEDKPSVEYCYSVHDDDGNTHVHVAATGDIDYSQQQGDMWIDRDDIRKLRDENAAEKFNDRTLKERRQALEEEQEVEREREEQQETEQQPERPLDGSHGLAAGLQQDQRRAEIAARGPSPIVEGEGSADQLAVVRDVVSAEQKRGTANGLDTDTATALVFAKIEDPHEMDETELKARAKEKIDEIEQEQEQDRGMGI